MPEYQATIKSNVKGVNSRKIKLLASCYSDAEKDVNKSLTKDTWIAQSVAAVGQAST